MSEQKKPGQQCPLCFGQMNIEEPLVTQPGSRAFPYCNKGHEFPDQEELQKLMIRTFPKKQAAPVLMPFRPPPPQPTTSSALKIPPPGPRPAAGEETATENPRQQDDTGDEIRIDKINFVRLSGILGHFTDASSLFGAIFALQAELLDSKELLERSEAARKLSAGPRRLGGDSVVQVVIPETHVEGVKQAAESNEMDIERYINSVVELGLNNGWFF